MTNKKRFETIRGRKVEIKSYSREELVRGEKWSTYYFIPSELIPEDSKEGWETFLGSGYWSFKTQFKGDLRFLGLDPQQYYNLYFLGESLDYHPNCSYRDCDALVTFLGVTLGYQPYCGSKCKALDQWEDSEFRKSMSDRVTKEWEDPESRLKKLIDLSLRAFLSNGDPKDECQLYLGVYLNGDDIKFGITNGHLGWRLKGTGLRSGHITVRNTREYVAHLEAAIKIERGDASEVVPFSELPKIIKIIRNFKLTK